jgi:hypothetical protein
MVEKMDQFTMLGFRRVGEWKLDGVRLRCDLAEKDPHGDFLYAFVTGKTIRFLEYSRLPLEGRMDAFVHTDNRYAGIFQPVNKRVREKLIASLEDGEAVEIWAFYPGQMEYEGFRVDLAAGLFYTLLKAFAPEWNGYIQDR